jgi:hypothetical protein
MRFAILTIAVIALYCLSYVAIRTSHVLVHFTISYAPNGELVNGYDAIVPGTTKQDRKSNAISELCWYIYWPIHKVETAAWKIKNDSK